MLTYGARLRKDTNGTFLATVPDLPEVVTFGETREEAISRVRDVVEDCLAEYVARRRPIPRPAKSPGRHRVTVPALTEMKIALYEALRSEGVTKSELARRMNVHPPQVDRLLDFKHASRLDQIEAALRALGQKLVVSIEAA